MKVPGQSSWGEPHAWRKLLALLSMVESLALAPFPVAAQPSGTNALYTTDLDFGFGTLQNTITTIPPLTTGQVEFARTISPFPYLYVSLSDPQRSSVVRIDVKTGLILGEYLTAPAGNGRNPSRTTVDQLGNVWVANHDENGLSPAGSSGIPKGSVTLIGLVVGGSQSGNYVSSWTYSTCVDRDGDGKIKTSSGVGDVLSWTGGGGGADTHGGVSTAEDECIINYTRVAGTSTRTLAIDRNNDLWVGGANMTHEKLNGALPPSAVSGQPITGTRFNLGCGGYGGFIDKYGVLWSARYPIQSPQVDPQLLRFDPASMTGTCFFANHGNYGLAPDPKTCHVWHTTERDPALDPANPSDPTLLSYKGQVVEMDAAGTVLNSYPHGQPFAQGVVVDAKDSVWVAHSVVGPYTLTPPIAGVVPATTVGHLKTNGLFVGNVPLVDINFPTLIGQGPTGVAVDTYGKVWVTNYYTDNVMRINPDLNPPLGAVDMTVDLGTGNPPFPGAAPYNYSDMTGKDAVSNPTLGFWNRRHDGGAPGISWGMIKWNTEPQASVPAGSSITVDARAADSPAALTVQGGFIPVTSGVPFSLTGRYIEVRASMKTTVAGDCVESPGPVLSDLRIVARTVCDIDVDGDVDQLDLSAISRARGQAPLAGDARDANGDGAISPADVKACIPKCTRASCRTR